MLIKFKYQHDLDELRGYSNVTLLHNLSTSEMISFYDSIDMLIIPSRADPLPTVAIEAMARKVLVIGNNIDGIPELVGDKDLLFNGLDAENVLRKIQQISRWNSQEIEARVQRQSKRAKQLFSSYEKVRYINNEFEKCLSE